MRDLKRMLFAALLLTFLGGIGLGAWVGSLAAAPPAPVARVDDRVEQFEKRLTLDATQMRQLRTILDEYDRRIRAIRREVSASQMRRTLAEEERSRGRIRAILEPGQQLDYDKLLGRG